MLRSISILIVLIAFFTTSARAQEVASIDILKGSDSSAEAAALKRTQQAILELQLIDIAIKNRRNQELDSATAAAVEKIQNKSQEIRKKIKASCESQTQALDRLLATANEFAELTNSGKIERTAEQKLIATKSGPRGPLELVTLTSVTLSPNSSAAPCAIYKAELPQRRSYWIAAANAYRAKGWAKSGTEVPNISQTDLKVWLDQFNAIALGVEASIGSFSSYAQLELFNALSEYRFGVLRRITEARLSLGELATMPSTMSAPEQYKRVYSQVMDSLFSFGFNVTGPVGELLSVKGVLFASEPKEAQKLLEKLK